MKVKELRETLELFGDDEDIVFEIGADTFVDINNVGVDGLGNTFLRSKEWLRTQKLAPFTPFILTLPIAKNTGKEQPCGS